MSLRLKLFLIMALAVVTAVLAYPKEDQILHKLGINSHLKISEGLDLQGGTYLVYQADMSKIPAANQPQTMASLITNLQRRVNSSGTTEATVTGASSNRVVVEIPNNDNSQSIIDELSKPAQLTFLEVSGQTVTDTHITGDDVAQATVGFDPNTGAPVINLQLKSGSSTKKFGDVTTQINQSNAQLLTLLDNQTVFGPANVTTPITNGQAQLSNPQFTVASATQTANLINAGRLPVPISLEEQTTISATLGQQSVSHSIVAGVIGLAIVALFMVLYYRLAGAMAVAALIIYTLVTLAFYKLSIFTPFPIVLSLAGVAGFILSIGMAVDANILIFERTKEEFRAGKSLVAAVETGFDRAWTSIRDSNVSTLLTCVILYSFSQANPTVRGFAVTLGIGVLLSMFTAVVVSRTFLRLIIRTRFGSHPGYYGYEPLEETN